MSKTQIVGVFLLLIGICLFYVLNSTNWSLLGAALIGFGVGVILMGRIGPFKK
ncbi:MAG: F0F1-type ATP synthase assembly protein I [Psychroserpens sp.]|jgi:F0F1-type ATP synthase assembly protein I